MTQKHIYTSNEIPDHDLEEYEQIRMIFLELISILSKNNSLRAINAGLAIAFLDFIKMSSKKNSKKALINTADYFLKAAEEIEEDK